MSLCTLKNKAWFKHLGLQALLLSLSGAAMVLAFAPFTLYWLAALCPIPLIALCLNSSWRRAAVLGLAFGLGFYGVGVCWVYVSIHTYGNSNIPIAIILTLLFVLVMALHICILCGLFSKLFARSRYAFILGFPALWILLEAIRSTIFTGFPWLLLGYSQVASPLAGWIPLIGNHGITLILLISASLIVYALRTRHYLVPLLCILLLWGSGYLLKSITWTQTQGSPISVSLVQANIGQSLKWEASYLPQIIARHRRLTQQETSELIIWSEASLPMLLDKATAPLTPLLKQIPNSGLIIGAIHYDEKHFYNSMRGFNRAQGTYHKYHLVPFGEFLPLDKWLRGLIAFFNLPASDFSAGPKQPGLLHLHRKNHSQVTLGILLCYEIAFADSLLRLLPQTELLVVSSNDAWFGNSFARAQHMQIAQFRARQAGRYLLFATNDGITSSIGPQGQVRKQLPTNQTGVLRDKVYAMQGATPWSHYGNLPLILLCSLVILLRLAGLFYRVYSHQQPKL